MIFTSRESYFSWWTNAEWLNVIHIPAIAINHATIYSRNVILIMLQILMSAKRDRPANAHSANAKTPGGVTSAVAVVVCSTRAKMTCVLVRLF